MVTSAEIAAKSNGRPVKPAGGQQGRAAEAVKDGAVTTAPKPQKEPEMAKAESPRTSKEVEVASTIESKQKAAEQRERAQNLERTVSHIEKTFGKGSIMKMDESAFAAVPGIPTGALSLDLALGGKGVPSGRIIEIYGPESSGKTTLALTVAANAQKAGGVAAFIDAEHALDPSWARRLGVNVDELLVSQPDTGEQALEICEMLVRSNAVDVIVIDSVAALVPRAEIEGEMGDSFVGLQARLMSQALRKLTGAIAKSRCTVIFINQIREKIGVMFGSPETTAGGRALKFYSSIRLDVRRISAIKEGDVSVGNRVRTRVVKNKLAPPFREAEFDIMFDEGISWAGDLLDLAVEDSIVEKSGSWFSYGEVRLGQGREVAKKFVRENPDLAREIRQAVLKVRLTPGAVVKSGRRASGGGGEDGE